MELSYWPSLIKEPTHAAEMYFCIKFAYVVTILNKFTNRHSYHCSFNLLNSYTSKLTSLEELLKTYRMSKIPSKTISCFFRLILIFQLNYHHQFTLAKAFNTEFDSNPTTEFNNDVENQSSFNERFKQIEDKSRYQEQEIAQLKMNAVKDRKVIHQLEGRVAQLEATSASASSILVRSKRPHRLLPPTPIE